MNKKNIFFKQVLWLFILLVLPLSNLAQNLPPPKPIKPPNKTQHKLPIKKVSRVLFPPDDLVCVAALVSDW